MRPGPRRLLLIIGAATLAACTGTAYRTYDEAHDTAPPASPFTRQVTYRVDRAFYAQPPVCVAILSSPEPEASDEEKSE